MAAQIDRENDFSDPSKVTNTMEDKRMRAMLLTGYGGYDKLVMQELPIPKPETGQVLIRVKTSGLNFAELHCRQGLYTPQNGFPPLPFSLGLECAGVVEQVGSGVVQPKPGTRVICLNDFGLWQEFAVVRADRCFPIPEGMSFEEAGALAVNYLTAYLMLFDFGNLQQGKSVLIHMAAGGVGIAATQLCKTVPDVTVYGTASAHKHEIIRENGVTHPIDYRNMDYAVELRKISPKGVDIVLDPLSGKDTMKGFELLRPMGKLIVFGAANMMKGEARSVLSVAKTWWNSPSFSAIDMMQKNKSVSGFHLGWLVEETELLTNAMNEIIRLYQAGRIKPKIDSVWHFENIKDAMKQMQERKNVGKVILSWDPKLAPSPKSKD
ncbi:synaptic vesicle membrane protein VAT-1 homolog [Anneissia japonica]|uniref:synaptic vesicle membrane protein VAT-1 homolog n=1 Tax=Anneissia japonica TaxID=1529436 RepID=UPI0014257A4C|nr:synaptic vesicle membrane protein VAT-1 homolog [Anneissia japonica]